MPRPAKTNRRKKHILDWLRYPKVVIKKQKKNHWFNCENNMYRKKKKEAPSCCIIGSTGHVNIKMLSLKAAHTISDFLCIDD